MSEGLNWLPAEARDDAISVGEVGSTRTYVTYDNGFGGDIDPDESDGNNIRVIAMNGDPDLVGAEIMAESGGIYSVDSGGYLSFEGNDAYTDLEFGESRSITFTYTITNGSILQEPGTFPAALSLSDLGDDEGFVIPGTGAKDELGYAVWGAGNVSNSGKPDLLVGAPQIDAVAVPGSGEGFAALLLGSDIDRLDDINVSRDAYLYEGEAVGDQTGFALATGRLTNGSRNDVLVSAPGVDTARDPGDGSVAGGEDAGRVYLVPSNYYNWGITSTPSYYSVVMEGEVAGWKVGTAVSAGRDISGDGRDDVLIGAHNADPSGKANAGVVYGVFGFTGDLPEEAILLERMEADRGFRIDGLAAGDELGHSVDNLGDVNGDGRGDYIIGAPRANVGEDVDAGRAYVLFGSSTAPGKDVLGSLDGSNGFALSGRAAYDLTGSSVSRAGDVNGDLIEDFLIGAPGADVTRADGSVLTNAGSTYVVYGTKAGRPADLDLDSLNGSNGFRVDGNSGFALSGFDVAAAGDVNGDGLDDILIGAPKSGGSGSGGDAPGATFVVFGQAGARAAVLSAGDLDGTNGFIINGGSTNGESGFSVSGVGDVSGDGIDDIIVGARFQDVTALDDGAAHVVYGRADLTPQTSTATVTLTVEGESLAPTLSIVDPLEEIEEGADLATARVAVGEVVLDDPDGGTNTLRLADPDNPYFELIDDTVYLRTDAPFDYERRTFEGFTVYSDDPLIPGDTDASLDGYVYVVDVDEPPTLSLSRTTATVRESKDTAARELLASIYPDDDAEGEFNLGLSGEDAAAFEILEESGSFYLYLKADVPLDYETKDAFRVGVTIDDPGLGSTPDATVEFVLSVADSNDPPTASWVETTSSLPEDINTSVRTRIGTFEVIDDTLGSESYTVTGPDARFFEIVGESLFLRPLSGSDRLDYESKSRYAVTVEIDDGGVGRSPDASLPFTLDITDVNEAPSVRLTDRVRKLTEFFDTSEPLQVAEIVVSDDEVGVANLGLSGPEADMFEIKDMALFLKAGETLDFEDPDLRTLDVTVTVDDPAIGGTPDDTATLSLDLTNENDPPTVSLEPLLESIPENTPLTSPVQVARVSVRDDRLGTVTGPSIEESDSPFFIRGNGLFLRAGTELDADVRPELSATVLVDDTSIGTGPDAEASYTLEVRNVDLPAQIDLRRATMAIEENTDTEERIEIANIGVLNDGDGPVSREILGGLHAEMFELSRGVLYLKAGTTLNFEELSRLEVTLGLRRVDDPDIVEDDLAFRLRVTDVNDAPRVRIVDRVERIKEDTVFRDALTVGRIEVIDEDTRKRFLKNEIDFSTDRDDRDVLDRKGMKLIIPAGTTLDHETNPKLRADVLVVDRSLGAEGEDTSRLAVKVRDVDEALLFTNGDDRQDGTPGDDRLDGKRGDDRIDGLDGNDRILGSAGDDTVIGGPGRDVLIGGTGKDKLQGGAKNDKLVGGGSNDRLEGGPGNDNIDGGSGRDVIVPGPGNDVMNGGSGPDTFVFGNTDGDNTIEGFVRGEDTFRLPGRLTEEELQVTKSPRDAKDTLITFAETEIIVVGVELDEADVI